MDKNISNEETNQKLLADYKRYIFNDVLNNKRVKSSCKRCISHYSYYIHYVHYGASKFYDKS